MTEQRIRYLFEQYFTNSCSETEKNDFLQLIRDGKQNDDLLDIMRECWETYVTETKITESDSERIFAGIMQSEKRETQRIISRKSIHSLVRIAAILLITLSLVFFIKRRINEGVANDTSTPVVSTHDAMPGGNHAILITSGGKKIILDSAANGMLAKQGAVSITKLANGKLVYEGEDIAQLIQYNTVATPKGGQYMIALTDGTKVWLNAASTLTFPTSFTGKSRDVTLTGEAYFEVIHNEAQPFRVHVENTQITDIGTHFNIMAYEEETVLETTVLEGAVAVANGNHDKKLVEGQQATWDKKDKLEISDHADTEQSIAWKNGLFQFRSTDINHMMRQISRWYDVEVVYADDVKNERFSGSIPSNEQLSGVLKILEETNTVRFEITNHIITVRKK